MHKYLMAALAGVALLFGGAALAKPARPDITIADFEAEDYGDWEVEGEAFGPGPATGGIGGQKIPSGFIGARLVNTFHKGDGAKGTLTSPEFKLERPYLNFMIGGGSRPEEACVNLLLDGKVARTATGNDDEQLDGETWDVADLIGKCVRIQIVDRATGSWGHVNVDHLVQSDMPKSGLTLHLLAALDRKAGGYGMAKKASGKDEPPPKVHSVFENADDPDYQILLAAITREKAKLDKIKRFDMPGFRPNEHYVREMKFYGSLASDFGADDLIDVYQTDRAYWRSLWRSPGAE